MVRQKMLLVAMIAVIALVVALSGCTFSKEISFGGNTTTATPTAKAPSVTATPKATTTASTSPTGPTVAPGTFKVTTSGKNVKITGNGVVETDTFQLPENWYATKLTYDGSKEAGKSDYIDIELISEDEISSTGIGLSQAGTAIYYEGIHYPETSQSTTNSYYVKTLAPTVGSWTLELTAPPAESSVATAPHTFTGTGPAIVGPVKLPTRNGKATITYSGPKEYFSVGFYQQDINYPDYPSFFIDLSASNADNIGSSGVQSPITKTVDIDNFDPNLMLLMSVDSPPAGTWSIEIAPA